MKVGSLFSGIGGLELGLERAGMSVVWQVEIEAYSRGILERHWPGVERFEDVRTVGVHDLKPVDLICGGFPCQGISLAGIGAGLADARSGLWREFRRIIEELRPKWVLVENVPPLRTRGLRTVLGDLHALGFDAEWTGLRAFDFGAPHLRDRIFIAASDPKRVCLREPPGWLGRTVESEGAPFDRRVAEEIAASDPDGLRRLESAWRFATLRGWPEHSRRPFDSAPSLDDGIPRGLVGKSRKALGNAVVPQVAEFIGRRIMGATP